MQIIESQTDTIFLEHDGWRYQLEMPGWRDLDIFIQSSHLNCMRMEILVRGEFTEFETEKYKLIRIGQI